MPRNPLVSIRSFDSTTWFIASTIRENVDMSKMEHHAKPKNDTKKNASRIIRGTLILNLLGLSFPRLLDTLRLQNTLSVSG